MLLPDHARQAVMRFVILRCSELKLNALAIIIFESEIADETLPSAFNMLYASKEPWLVMVGYLRKYAQGHAQLEFSEANLRYVGNCGVRPRCYLNIRACIARPSALSPCGAAKFCWR
jgi:hypothetical protein